MKNLPQLIKIQKRNIKTEIGPITLTYILPSKSSKKEILEQVENVTHLNDLLTMFDGEVHKKIIIQCDDINSGICSVGQIACCMNEDSSMSLLETDIDFDDDDFYFEDCLEIESSSKVEDDKDKFFITYESEFDPDCNNIGETSSMEQMMPRLPKFDYTDFKNLIFVCDGLFTLTEKSLSFIQSFDGNIVVVVPKINKNTTSLTQLTFESDFELYSINSPSNQYLANQFEKLAFDKGFNLDNKINLEKKIEELRRFRGARFQEYDLSIYLDKCIKLINGKHKGIVVLASLKNNIETVDKQVSMTDIVGLDDIKEKIYQELYKNIHIAQRSAEGNPIISSYKHVAFVGNPGTCKTTMARIVAKLYMENNIISNGFYEFGREDIVGRYLGETSQKVSRIFKMAEGGVVFLDEIGALLTGNNTDSFGEEALNTIIRFMENKPSTMVIMATYPKEMKRLLSINPGLQSRLSNIISFPDYTNDHLLNIFTHLAQKSGYVLEKGYEKLVMDYFNKIRSKENFGNGREARRLLDNIISHLSVELIKSSSKRINFITLSSINKGIEDLIRSFILEKKTCPIGFATRKS